MREISLHVLDVLENSLEAGATRVTLCIEEDWSADRLTIAVQDDGRGMDADTLARVLDPFFTTRVTRHVGLGLPLFAAAAERCNGKLTVESKEGGGTLVRAAFRLSHIDRAPLGDITGTLISFLLGQHHCDLRYVHRVNGEIFEFDTREIRAILGEVPLSYPTVREWLREFIDEGEREIGTTA